MNVKPGDIAVYVFDTIPDNIGALVRVVEPGGTYADGSYANDSKFYWRVESLGRPLKFEWCEFGHPTGEIGWNSFVAAPDAWLKPLRDGEGEDETTAWVIDRAFKAKEPA